jgi:hypothetical protein
MISDDEKLFELWRIKPRGADGKRPRPCDMVVVVTKEETQELMSMPPAQRATAARLKAAEQFRQQK